ncbi:MAG TPA: hypothetical protein VE825_13600 [Terriglobales bacterium]|nr:hypothetical protein [Terriglobales bacterium]
MKVHGLDGLSGQQLQFELQRGAKFVVYNYCVSLLVITFKRAQIYFVRSEENRVVKGLPWTLLSLVLGWWGIPWGPIYTIQALVVNLGGGKDVTQQMLASMQKPAQPVVATGPAPMA